MESDQAEKLNDLWELTQLVVEYGIVDLDDVEICPDIVSLLNSVFVVISLFLLLGRALKLLYLFRIFRIKIIVITTVVELVLKVALFELPFLRSEIHFPVDTSPIYDQI